MKELADDIDILYHKVNDLDNRLTEVESTRPFLQEMIEREVNASEKLSDTMHAVQMSMVQMNAKMDEQAHAIENLQRNSTESSQKLNNRLTELEEKNRFDILSYIKANLPTIIVVGALACAYFLNKV